MWIKCFNPACDTPFDYREGRLIRSLVGPGNGRRPEVRGTIRHFWLCGDCAERFVFERKAGATVAIKPRAWPRQDEEELANFASVA
jgi:hypothetical protein